MEANSINIRIRRRVNVFAFRQIRYSSTNSMLEASESTDCLRSIMQPLYVMITERQTAATMPVYFLKYTYSASMMKIAITVLK